MIERARNSSPSATMSESFLRAASQRAADSQVGLRSSDPALVRSISECIGSADALRHCLANLDANSLASARAVCIGWAEEVHAVLLDRARLPHATAHATAHSTARFRLPLVRGKESRPPAQSQISPSTTRWTRHRRLPRARSSSTVARYRSRTRTTTLSHRLQTEVRARAKKFAARNFLSASTRFRSHRRGDGPRPQGGGEGAGEDELALRGQRPAGEHARQAVMLSCRG